MSKDEMYIAKDTTVLCPSRRYDNEVFILNLKENAKKLADLLNADTYEVEYKDAQVVDLEEKLAGRDEYIKVFESNYDLLLSKIQEYDEKCKNLGQYKTSFAVEQLEKVKGKIQHNILFVNRDDYVNAIEEIDNQIAELKKEMK